MQKEAYASFCIFFTRIYSVKLVYFPFNAKIEEQISYKTV
ncbi:hypothetical protein HMPREF1383_00840 [Enterococcus faecium V689]|nr:hypothetical protein HMPREF1383_00840 [Enterococcus faecium V689]EJX54454.1 hypothetical protein HMPREF1379_01311 [Enterococcus faecium R497]EJX66815.1 hypothetical protein HMPREF1374_00900 [Enterococcus faecium P1190]EJX77860.1 hypothetical protein HMPREF1372_01121 [Enterococcus faecium P1139]EJX80006.1 hypothetical protein HMPREF1370_01791 [Enterococcus faecium P1123]EJY32472.1 hypothetical protein HMPREF1353_00883 [Enterococcus faecium 513]EJY53379.1 hypothetical protein HMPREF1346_0103